MDVANANCLTCHDAHGGLKGSRASLHPQEHKPYGEGKCDSCHVQGGGSDLKKAVPDLCWDCHAKDKEKDFLGKVQHSPVFSGKGCLNCHSPHTSDAKSLLAKSAPELCFNCHDKAMMEKKYKHEAAVKNCFNCHLPHTADQPFMLKDDLKTLCMSCHKKVENTHMHGMFKNPYVDLVTGELVNCISCHNPHSSDNEKLTNGDRHRVLCTRCHKKGSHEL
jgi:predicted CXXCH cytochrome family protein